MNNKRSSKNKPTAKNKARDKDENSGLPEESEAKFRGFIENLPVMFYAAEPHPPYSPIYISPAFKLFGYPLEDWYGSKDFWVQVLHEDDRERILRQTEKAMKAGGETDYEYRIVARDESVYWVRDRGCFIKDKEGNAVCWQGVILDVTKRKHAEHELKRREKLYRTLAQNIPHTAVLLFDHDFRYTLAEGAQLKRHGFSRKMFEGKTLYEVFPPEISEEWSDYYRRALRGEIVSLESANDEGVFQIYVVPVKNEAEEVFAGMVVWQDITERKLAEESLKQSEARYRNLFENANDLIYVHDLKGNYISINHAAECVFGYTREEALKMNIKQTTAPEHWKTVKQMLSKKLAGAAQTAYEVDCITKSGERLTLEVNSNAIYKDGEPVAIQGTARNITERKRAEKALQNSEAELRALFAAMTDVILVLDREGRYLKIAPTNPSLLYKPAEELTGKTLHEVFPKEQADYFLWGVREALAKRASVRLEYNLNVNDRQVYFTAIVSPMMEDSVVFVARDITERKQAEVVIKESEEQYRELFENANDLVYTHNLQGNFTSLNRAGEIITGYSREEALKMNIAQVVAPEFLEAARGMIARKVAGEAPTAYELEIIAKDGRRVSLELSTRLIFQNASPVGVQGIGRDITERKRAEQSLHNTVSLFVSTFESTAEGIIVVNPERQEIITCNKKFVEMWGVPAEIIDRNDVSALGAFLAKQLKNPEEFLKNLEKLYADPDVSTTEILEFKDGRICERYSQPQFMEGKPVGRVCCFRDITERLHAEEKLLHYAMHDPLTNLPNRAQFMNHLRTAVERAKGNSYARFAVLFLDLDRFKVINDSLGHVIGDKLLVVIAERLKSCVRPGDVVARLGGDEFTILLNRTGEVTDVARVAERLQKRLSEPFKLDNYEVFTSASIGIIVSDEVSREPDDFLRDADAAMYRAKESGKARYEIFDREMHVRNINLLKVETDLRHAVERDEFEVFYQPIVSLETGEIREFEALIRWQHPELGLIAPKEFISVAEETGLIIQIGKWILEKACRQTSEWQKRFSLPDALSISVNLSARQLMHPALLEQVVEILKKTGLSARCLKLEVTESTVMEHSEKALGVLSELRELGISLSTDDFGTGYSSLSYLHRFPFERLKIDRSFINKMDLDAKSEAIVRTILMLGQNLNIETVAEGIETEKQLERLRSLGCPLGQGYIFSKPLKAKLAQRFLEEDSPFMLDSPFAFGDAGQILEVSEIH